MLFNSNEFIFIFLPIVLLVFRGLCHSAPERLTLSFLTLASWLFYACWNPAYFPLLLGSIVFNYVLSQKLDGKQARFYLTLGLSGNLLLLAYYKYAHFFIDNLALLFQQDWHFDAQPLPLAISFFTFQQLAYLLDHYQKPKPDYSFLHYSAFIAFFPQLIAGPIVKHDELIPQLKGLSQQPQRQQDYTIGLMIFTLGLAKKVLIADQFAPYANSVFAAAEAGEPLSLLEAWGGALAYGLQLYFDFSGYSDMALGLARLFGIRLPLNFNSPYKATSIIDFWRRWHMTLSAFLRHYLYIPLGGNRGGAARRTRNLMITMLLGGLWHGAGWNFVLWGGLHGAMLMINHLWREHAPAAATHLPAWGFRGLTFIGVIFAWVPFRAESFDASLHIWGALLGAEGLALPAFLQPLLPVQTDWLQFGAMVYFYGAPQCLLTLGALWMVWALPNTYELSQSPRLGHHFPRLQAFLQGHSRPRHLSAYSIGGLMFVSALAINSLERMDFLYFNF